MATSSYADILRQRGFISVPALILNGVPQTREDGRPRFFMMSQINMTLAVDEIGEGWMKSGVTDLTDLGFENMSSLAKKVLQILGSIEGFGERFEIRKLQ